MVSMVPYLETRWGPVTGWNNSPFLRVSIGTPSKEVPGTDVFLFLRRGSLQIYVFFVETTCHDLLMIHDVSSLIKTSLIL